MVSKFVYEIPPIVEQIFRQSVDKADKVALIDAKSGVEISYSELWTNIRRACLRLLSLGIKKGDRIIVSASKSFDFIYAYFGAHLAGIIVSPVDSEINALRLQRIVEATSPALVLGDISHAESMEIMDFTKFNEIDVELRQFITFPSPYDIADILFTTGTTGIPKGVALSFFNESVAAINIDQFIGNTSDDIELLALPISHSFGLGRLRCMLSIGATVVILGSFASMKKFFGAIEKYNVSGFGMVPASWAYISKMSGEKIGSFANQLRYIEIGSAPLPFIEKERLMQLLPKTKICMHYGLTEASRSSFISFHDEREHLDSAGKASPNCELAIFSETGERLPAGEDGEVCVRGGHVCSGYWNASDENYRNDFFNGFFRTGDWGSIDENGYLHLKSRTKEMINVGGKKVSPMEVEEALESIPGINEAACIGIPDTVMGEVVKAYIVGSLSSEDDQNILNHLAKSLENYKIPAQIDHVASLPRTDSGKLQRLKLKDLDSIQ